MMSGKATPFRITALNRSGSAAVINGTLQLSDYIESPRMANDWEAEPHRRQVKDLLRKLA